MRLSHHALHLRPISLGYFRAITRYRCLQSPVISEHEQPFAIRIQPPRRIDIRDVNELSQRALVRLASELREYAIGFVEEHQHRDDDATLRLVSSD